MAAAERSRSPVPGGSPVPACMFAPEPGSPGGRPRVAAAACPLRAALDGEDGEALNGEPDIDLTSKVGPAGARAAASAITPAGAPLLSACRPAVLPPEPGLLRTSAQPEPEPGARLPPLSAPPAPASPGRAAEPALPCGGGREKRRLSRSPAGTGGCWQGCSALCLRRLGCPGTRPARSRCSIPGKGRVWSCQLLRCPR